MEREIQVTPVIPTKCQSCGDETVQLFRFPRLIHKRV